MVYIELVRRGHPHRIGDTDMTNSERFIEAHKTAKQIRDCFSSYRGAFAFALKEIYAMEKTQPTDIAIATAAEADAVKAAFPGDPRAYDRLAYVQSQIDAYLA